ncbi:Protein transport protein Sec31A [Papilio machaon]|uniref:Protein transport protein Sec31A n=1 Tax=Papilio machaon TaxID=76193 RepID=A0A0N1I6R9_PAPMA|nr:Protein transport protein Sec31A [Papilio machaon]
MLESFGVAGSLGALPSVSRAPAQPPPQPSRAPAWLRRPRAAKFGFGGKLVTFDKCPQEAGSQKMVYISQVVSEPELVERAAALDGVLGLTLSQEPAAADQLAEYCRQRGEAAVDQQDRYVWFFLRASFLPTFRTELLNLLGFKQDEIPAKFKSTATSGDAPHDLAALSRGESTETEAELSTDTSTDLSDAHTLIERKLANIELSPSVSNVVIPNAEDPSSMICRALVCGNVEEAVELCLEARRVADALVIAALGGPELVRKVQQYHLAGSARDPVSLVAGAVLGARWPALLAAAAPASWRHTLAALVTHCDTDMLPQYCEMLGAKLSQESDPALRCAATLCYVCAARADALPASGAGRGAGDAADLIRRAELALLLRCAAETRGREQKEDTTSDSLQEYAYRLAEQGCLQSALGALRGARCDLADRLQHALGMRRQHQQPHHQPHQQPQAARARTLSAHSAHSAHSQPQPHSYPQHHQHLQHVTHNDIAGAFGSSVPVASDAGSWQAQQPRPPSVGPPSVGPHTAHSGGIMSRSKYKVDPSVQAPNYNQYSYNNPVTS